MKTVCESCGTKLNVPDRLLGKTVRCPKCQAAFASEEEQEELQRRSWLKYVVTGAIVAACLAVSFFLRRSEYREVKVGTLLVRYDRTITEEEATRAGQFVSDAFSGQHPIAMNLSKKDNTYQVTFGLKPQAKMTPAVAEEMEAFAFRLAKEVLPPDVVVHIHDSDGKLLETVRPKEERTLVRGKLTLVYRDITEDQARELARVLPGGEATVFHVRKVTGMVQLRLAVKDTKPLSDAEVDHARALCRDVSKVSGPVELHYCDETLRPFAVVTVEGRR